MIENNFSTTNQELQLEKELICHNCQNAISFKEEANFFSRLKKNYSIFDLHMWVAMLGFLLGVVLMGLIATNFINQAQNNTADRIWFGILDRFTYQSNVLVFFFFCLYIFNPSFKIFRGDKFLISSMVYIFFTFVGYNVVLVGISGDRAYVGNSFAITNNVWTHILYPLFFIFFGLIKLWMKPDPKKVSFLSTLLPGMIYPTIYLIYLISIPFIYQVEGADGTFSTYTIYGNATNTKDRPTSWAYILVMYLAFFPGSFVAFYYFNRLKNKILKK